MRASSSPGPLIALGRAELAQRYYARTGAHFQQRISRAWKCETKKGVLKRIRVSGSH